MIDCPYCDIKFSPSYKTCPNCNAYKTPWQERVRYLKLKAEEFAGNNAERNQVREYLIDNGLSDIEADRTLDVAFSGAANENRSFGCLRTIAGCGMLIFGGLALFALALTLRPESTVRLDGKSMAVLAIFGGGLTIGGLLAIISGMYSTMIGKS